MAPRSSFRAALSAFVFLFAALCAGSAFAQTKGKLSIYFFDIGQGDGSLIVTPSGKTVLVDGGPPEAGAHLAQRLRELTKNKLDLAVMSHPHLDHLGAMIDGMSAVGAKRFLDPGFNHSSKSYRDLLEWAGQNGVQVMNPIPDPKKPEELVTIGLGDGIVMHVLWPRVPNEPFLTNTRSDPNSNSIVFKLVYGKTAFLFTGDAEPDTEGYLLQKNIDFTSTLLKVGHHGGRHSSTTPFLKAIKPKVAIIQCGTGNDYGHPTPAAMERLKDIGADIWRNDLEGEIKVVSDGTNLTVTAEKPQGDHAKGLVVAGETPSVVAKGPILPGERTLSDASKEDAHKYGRSSDPPPETQVKHAAAKELDPPKAAPKQDPETLIPADVKDRYAVPVKGTDRQVKYVASKKSDVFHMADCQAVQTIKAKNRVQFWTRTDAAKSKRPAEDCNP